MSREDHTAGANQAQAAPASFVIMGIVNVTPDSFSDGGLRFDPRAAADAALELAAQGADVIDVGAESTRPGASSVDEETEWRRLEPVLARLTQCQLSVPISVDTRRPKLMLKAAEAGVRWINDVGGAADVATLAKLATFRGMNYVATHMHGTPQTMQLAPLHGAAATQEAEAFFCAVEARAALAKLDPKALWLDPGVGFGKDDSGNLAVMRALPSWQTTGRQLAIGVSRKGFIGRAVGIASPQERDAASKMLELGLVLAGAKLVRTHAVSALARLRTLMSEEARVAHA